MSKYINGSLWKDKKTLVMLQQLTGELFCLLDVSSGGFSLVTDPVHTGKWQYSAEEIPERLEGFEPQVGHVSIVQPAQTPTAEEIRAAKTDKEEKILKTVKKKVKDGKI